MSAGHVDSRLRRAPLPQELRALEKLIFAQARAYGLDFYDIVFELVDYEEMNEVASYGGFPTRYPHWRYGMDYDQFRKGYTYGLQKIYELVINNDPCYAYLLTSNSLMDQKLVMSHVCGHADFFKHNEWFKHTNRKMLDEMANHGTRVRHYYERYGQSKVEAFIDTCLSLENLIDIYMPHIVRSRPKTRTEMPEEEESQVPRKLRSKEYMDRFINPPEFLDEQKKRIQEEVEKRKNVPEEPARDVLLFLMEYAPLERWQRDVLSIVREESYYFAPQGMTKIMNEGWASYWHSTLMTKHFLEDSEVVDYADHHSGTMGTQPGRLNPYKVGIELFRDIEERWDKGRFGREWEECDDERLRRTWDRNLKLGREKIFQVRRIFNDLSFIDEFLNEDFCKQQKLFVYEYDKETGEYVISGRQFKEIKEKLLFSLTNFGQPIIYVTDANYKNRGELYLMHQHIGVDLRLDHARDTLAALFRIWSRPVHLETAVESKRKLLSYDGKQHQEKVID